MADCFQTPAHNQLTGIVEQKINNYKLNIFKDDKDYKKLQKSSPLWKDLQSGSSRVKRLSKMFEEKSKTFSRKTNWWLDEKVYKSLDSKSPPPTKTSNFSTPPTRKARNSVGRSLESIDSPSKLSKLDRIVHELLQKEVSYIQALERGIEFYVRVIKEGDGEVPAALRNQAFRLFGNIEEICKLHKSSVYPRLTLLKGNVRLVAELISSFIQNDQFYCYIVYAMNQKSAEQFIAAYNDFFDHLRSKSNDFLGISSFIIQPIQKLPRYKMLLDEMIKELSRDVTAIDKPTVAACCVAEKNVQRLLVRLNEALSINDIIETHEFGASVQLGILTTMQRDFGVDIDEPMMILVPRMSSNFPFRSPVRKFKMFHNLLFNFEFCSSMFTAWESS